MKLKIVISPDFGRERGIDWDLLAALMRRRNTDVELLAPANLREYENAISTGGIDVVLANPIDAIALVRCDGFIPFARPTRLHDEMLISSAATSPIRTIIDLRPGCRIALTTDRFVEVIGMRLLEPAGLDNSSVQHIYCETSVAASDLVVSGSAEIAFFAAESYSALPLSTRRRLNPLVKSEIGDLSHLLLCHPQRALDLADIRDKFVELAAVDMEAASAIRTLGLEIGFTPLTRDAAEDMLDLAQALLVPSATFAEL
ncbi:PhnD/SsuA/transferrin family substrate-binding protein [Piscinibacter sp.]|jgi:hypothetical protein|uniref:PhnD/SsuA/transferrin family substrate-binding protein n=1 Tax=Piscinibacter sp. TaxID=1903157 RepID=UPI001B4BAF75|nr:PhnD/SsuA/transferrin family substrate-binding protein [Piscinibacter sp.]MBK7532319.1 PhnD/SsuA/transferrin family substrate-binding protein [Piscinibacter sp.]MBP6541766.1 PhnD/SsuA/transferrin family substrate-binding protein [Piscinibacter sp.]